MTRGSCVVPQRNASQPVTSEANGAGQTTAANGTTPNGQPQVPLIRFSSRRFNQLRRATAREESRATHTHVLEPLTTQQLQEQEI